MLVRVGGSGGRRTIARERFQLAPRKTSALTLRLSSAAAASISDDATPAATLSVTATKRGYAPATAVVRLTLVAASATDRTMAAADDSPPSATARLTVTPNTGWTDLRWSRATDDIGVANYQVERCRGANCTDFTALGSTSGTSYGDTGTVADTGYRYRVRALDSSGQAGAYSNIATTRTLPEIGPLHVDAGGRYLVDGTGKPFLMTGESPQALIGDLTEADAERFFSTRKAQGFNTVWVNLLCNRYTGCRQDGHTWDDVAPFTTPEDLATPNDAYFERVDRMLRLAAKYGFVVLLDPIETGGWRATVTANRVAKDRAYGRYLGSRYARFSNVIWMSGNDYQKWNAHDDRYLMAVAQGIRDTNPTALQTVELDYYTSGSLDDARWKPLIDMNASYTYNPTYRQVLKDYNRSDFLPTFLVEGGYEGEQNADFIPPGTPELMRRQEYWSLLSGATGQIYGNHYTWQFLCRDRDANGDCNGGWRGQMASPGAEQMTHVVSLFGSRPWYRLVPDQDHHVVTAGYGTFGDRDYVTAASTPDGKLAMAYVPTARVVTVDLGALSGPVTARWYDPTNGRFTRVGDGTPRANDGTVQLLSPGTNADGDDDWVLVLDAS
jgi:hypothetical protein